MAETVIYKVYMKASGRLTQLPDSQKIFGALIYLYADQTSEAQAAQFVKAVKEKILTFSLSNMMPADYLPVPERYLLSIEGRDKEFYKCLKKYRFIKSEQLESLLKEPQQLKTLFPYVRVDESHEMHAAVDRITYQLPGTDLNLYSVPEITVSEVNKKGEGLKIDNYYFYLALELGNEGISFVKALEDAGKQERMIFLGPRASRGLNIYNITDMKLEKDDRADTEYYLNLGMLLPDHINYQKSFIDTFSSIRLPYKRQNGWDKHMTKKYISYISAGSILCAEKGKYAAGKSVTSEYDSSRAIIFGNAMLYPIRCNIRTGGDDVEALSV